MNLTLKIIFSFLITAIIAIIDLITGNEISFSIFYLIPVIFASWYIGRISGLILSVISASVWLIIDTSGFNFTYGHAIHFWNTMVRLGFFITVTVLIVKIKQLHENQDEIIQKRTNELIKEIDDHKKSKNELISTSSKLRELNSKIESIREEQNSKIAREIHDELGQSLTAINLELQWINKKYSDNIDIVNRMQMLGGIVTNTIATVRKISSDLRPRLLDQLGLIPAVESLIKDFTKHSGINITYNLPSENIKFESTASIMIYRIIQEALTNISRHSGSDKAEVLILNNENLFTAKIKDFGRGFDKGKKITEAGSLGIIGMYERTNIIKGSLDIVSINGSGTEVILKVPLN